MPVDIQQGYLAQTRVGNGHYGVYDDELAPICRTPQASFRMPVDNTKKMLATVCLLLVSPEDAFDLGGRQHGCQGQPLFG